MTTALSIGFARLGITCQIAYCNSGIYFEPLRPVLFPSYQPKGCRDIATYVCVVCVQVCLLNSNLAYFSQFWPISSTFLASKEWNNPATLTEQGKFCQEADFTVGTVYPVGTVSQTVTNMEPKHCHKLQNSTVNKVDQYSTVQQLLLMRKAFKNKFE